MFYKFATNGSPISNVNKVYGITQNQITKNFMIITKYYEIGDLTHYITKDFFEISWENKLKRLKDIVVGLRNIHHARIIHKDYHSGNIFFSANSTVVGDLGLSKSSLNNDNDNEIYGIIPYVAPEIFQGQKYTEKSDIYSFGMIMWEVMTGRRPFWDRNHDTRLIIEICDGLRPPIVTNAPKGYIELMQRCWDPDPKKRSDASSIRYGDYGITGIIITAGLNQILADEKKNPTKIIESSDIGPIKAYNPGAIYKSRPLSAMIKSAESTRSLSIISEISK